MLGLRKALFLLGSFAIGSTLIERWRPARQRDATAGPSWSAAVVTVAAAAILMAVEVLVLGG
jgi:hypothetical protein